VARRGYGVHNGSPNGSPITGFCAPFVCKEELDSVAASEEHVTVTPDAVLCVRLDDFIRFASVPESLGSLNFA
jgi:hypothetical protein